METVQRFDDDRAYQCACEKCVCVQKMAARDLVCGQCKANLHRGELRQTSRETKNHLS